MDAAACVEPVRASSRRLVRELGFLRGPLADSGLPPSAVHALVEIGAGGGVTAGALAQTLVLEKSSVSRMLAKLVASGCVSEGIAARDGRAKPLSLTDQGREALAAIDRFANRQVVDAMRRLGPAQRQTVVEGLRLYAEALAADRLGADGARGGVIVETGYQAGVLARCVEMQTLYYARTTGFGLAFETKVAADMADFVARLERPDNQLWRAVRDGRVIGAVAVDGEDLGAGRAHLRWFIVDEGARGGGVGRRLLSEAVAFCDRRGFAETHLWTLRGLDVARRLYEAHGFRLAEEWLGRQWGAQVVEQRFVRRAERAGAAAERA